MLARKTPTFRLSAVSEDELIREISSMISELTGVQLGEKQRHMVSSRLHKHMMNRDLATARDYVSYFNSNAETETQELISILTTHHSYFFREFAHFEFLRDHGLKALVEAAKVRGQKKIRFWSAACSRGQEVYSLAMFLDFHLRQIDPQMGYEILGTDVDPQSVATARNGVYHRQEISAVPAIYLGNAWARGTGEIADFVKIKNTMKANCRFETVNLLDFPDPGKPFDAIFCRNVFIYFTRAQIMKISERFLNLLNPEGYLFLGISESLNGMDLKVRSVASSVYGLSAVKPQAQVAPRVERAPSKILRVLCVDDSPTVHTLMKQVLKPEFGFEVVGRALNGLEAAEFLKKQSVDLMTLDIHMPEQTGIEYLEKNFKESHPPVVMVSSVSRDNADLAIRALQLGASDYVEKPALNQLADQAEQIRMKLQCAFLNQNLNVGKVTELDRQFQAGFKIDKPDETLRICVANLGDRKKLRDLIREFNGDQPPTVILIDGAEETLTTFAADLSSLSGRTVNALSEQLGGLQKNRIYVADFKKMFSPLKLQYSGRKTSVLIYGKLPVSLLKQVCDWNDRIQILLEDLSDKAPRPSAKITDIVPGTSFAYMSSKYLGDGNG